MKNITSLVLACALVFTFGCQKDGQIASQASLAIENMEDVVLVNDLMNEIFEDADLESIFPGGDLKSGSIDCRKVTVEPNDRTSWPKTITIDFGSDGCLVHDSIVKAGKIIITQSTPQRSEAWEKVVRYENYSVNGNKIEGIHTIGFHIRSGHPVWTNTLANGKITGTNGVITTREANHTRVQMRGIDTPRDRMDDVFHITGNTSGINRNGKTFSSVIKEALVMHTGCRWIRKGVKEIILDGQSPAILDFGTGECDNTATLTQDGESKTITLKGWRRK